MKEFLKKAAEKAGLVENTQLPKDPKTQGGRHPERAVQVERARRSTKPTWMTFYNLGRDLNERMDGVMEWKEIGRRFGISSQNAYTEGVVALGKLAFRLKEAVREERRKAKGMLSEAKRNNKN